MFVLRVDIIAETPSLPTQPLVEQIRAAGLYRMVIPRALGGLQVDLLTYLRTSAAKGEGDGPVMAHREDPRARKPI